MRYDTCTTRDSDTGQPWCATQVDSEGWVVDHAWGDCDKGCPGTSEYHRHVSLLLKYLTMQLMNVTRATSQFKKVNV